jgi:hypothetical protein
MIWMEMEQLIIESITSVNNSAIKNIKQVEEYSVLKKTCSYSRQAQYDNINTPESLCDSSPKIGEQLKER